MQSFDNCIHPGFHNHDHDIKYIYNQISLVPFCSHSNPNYLHETTTDLVSTFPNSNVEKK